MEQNEGNLGASSSEVVEADAVRFADSTSPAPSPALGGGPDEPDEPRPAETAAELPTATGAALLEMVLRWCSACPALALAKSHQPEAELARHDELLADDPQRPREPRR
ncbi:hypothetical protein predicted by Glimmer/Critica [Sorangium cellulosum So ce56]|uniref:Uncharacterized protein n=1 Tax=Sorangium cellulosum (strain So ce56) TaxID=448385 RepID=A9F415_SORC5|nr:hypothetical protein predicted by Glimmer/Critica [Sorangium cellulosum So ce56]